MQEPERYLSEEIPNRKLRKKQISTQRSYRFHPQGNDVKEVQQAQASLELKTGQKAFKRKSKAVVSAVFQQPERPSTYLLSDSSASGNEYRTLLRKYLLLEEESCSLGEELREVEDEVRTLEGEKVGLLDQLVVLEGLIDPSELQSVAPSS